MLFSPDGGQLALALEGGGVLVLDRRREEVTAELRGEGLNVWSMEFSRDGSQLAVIDDEGIRVWPMDLVRHARAHCRRVRTFAERGTYDLFTPGERMLVPKLRHLFEEHILVDQVVATIDGDPELDADRRGTLRRLAEVHGNPAADRLALEALHLASTSGQPLPIYERALKLRSAAQTLAPNSFNVVSAKLLSSYRCGVYAEAVTLGEQVQHSPRFSARDKAQATQILAAVKRLQDLAASTDPDDREAGERLRKVIDGLIDRAITGFDMSTRR